jgi:hypothetical protein
MGHNGYRGLCVTCEGRATCTYPHHQGQFVLFCEEFDWAWQHRMEMAALTPLQRKPQPVVAEKKRTPSRYRGLCSTCAKQEECVFPKPAGGIWHCEEFE